MGDIDALPIPCWSRLLAAVNGSPAQPDLISVGSHAGSFTTAAIDLVARLDTQRKHRPQTPITRHLAQECWTRRTGRVILSLLATRQSRVFSLIGRHDPELMVFSRSLPVAHETCLIWT
jgi:hypothetical protein